VEGQTIPRHRPPSNRTLLGKRQNSRGAIGTTRESVPNAIALGHMCAKDAAKPTPCQPAQINKVMSEENNAIIVHDTSLEKVAPTHVRCANRHVETEHFVAPEITYTVQGAPALQQHVRSPPAPSGQRTAHTPHRCHTAGRLHTPTTCAQPGSQWQARRAHAPHTA
jgi:hypothetical protein